MAVQPKKISDLTVSTTIDGSEILPMLKAGANRGVALATVLSQAGHSPTTTIGYANADVVIPSTTTGISSYLNAALTSAVSGTSTSRWIHVKAGTYIVDAPIVIPSGVTITGDGNGATIFKAANGLNNDMFITKDFYSNTGNDYIAYTTSFIKLCDFQIIGNSGNQSPSGATDPAQMHKSIAIFAYKVNVERVMIYDSLEVAFYSEFSNHQNTTFENYETLPNIFEDIDVKGYGQYGIVYRGPHDSYMNRCFAATGPYAFGSFAGPVAAWLIDQGTNYGLAGMHIDNCYGNGPNLTANVVIRGFPSVTGSFYAEGSPVAAFDIQAAQADLRLFAGYSPIGIIYRGDSGGSMSRNRFTTKLYYTEPPIAYKIIGNVQQNIFDHIGGNPTTTSFPAPTGGTQLYNIDTYTGGNNEFRGRAYVAKYFSDTTKLTKSDKLEIIRDDYPDNLRNGTWSFPQADQAFVISDTGTLTAKPLGFSVGAGGTVTQTGTTDKTTAVTLSKITGTIVTNATALASGAIVSFTWTNTFIASTDQVIMHHVSGGTVGAYIAYVQPGSGTATVTLRNASAGSLSEALTLKFTIIKSVNS